MDIIVFSDSHGNGERMTEMIRRSGADAVIFLGDGLREFEKLQMADRRRRIYISVRGNCDVFENGTPLTREFELEGVTFLALHGHTMNVKHGTKALEEYAKSRGIDIVLYGHTHVPDDRYLHNEEDKKPLIMLNPGSIGDSYKPSFATVTVKNGQILTNCALYTEEQ